MPVVVYKTMTIIVHHTQMRRIRCEHCNEIFTVIAGGTFSSETKGIPVVSNEDNMRRAALKDALKQLRRIADSPRDGVARCPSCNETQGWMRRSTYLGAYGIGLLLGLFMGFMFGVLFAAVFDMEPSVAFSIGGAIGLVAMMGYGYSTSKKELDGPRGDPRAMTDDELSKMLRLCEEDEMDPALYWFYSVLENNPPAGNDLVLSLGMRDDLGTFDVPADVRTDAIVAALER